MTIRRWMKVIAVIAWICAVVAGGPYLGTGIVMATICTGVGLYSVRYPAFAYIAIPVSFVLILTPIGMFLPFLVVGSILASLVGSIVGRVAAQSRGSYLEAGVSPSSPALGMSQLTREGTLPPPFQGEAGGALPVSRHPFLAPTVRGLMVVLVFWGLLVLYLRATGIVERLNDPIAVQGWTAEGLITGKTVIPLPGIGPLPATSLALTQAIPHGVEVAPDGRVYGLVKIHHWCGNDPVRHHLARVDLASMLVFLGEAKPPGGLNPRLRSLLAAGPGWHFSGAGWRMDEFYHFQRWCEIAEDIARSRPAATAGPATSPSPSPSAGPAARAPQPPRLNSGSRSEDGGRSPDFDQPERACLPNKENGP